MRRKVAALLAIFIPKVADTTGLAHMLEDTSLERNLDPLSHRFLYVLSFEDISLFPSYYDMVLYKKIWKESGG